jgi:acyl-coenzyme A thioesterase PaaI-like protein
MIDQSARGAISAYARVVTPTERWAAELETRGKALANVAVEVKDGSGTLVAEMQVEWHVSRTRSAT